MYLVTLSMNACIRIIYVDSEMLKAVNITRFAGM